MELQVCLVVLVLNAKIRGEAAELLEPLSVLSDPRHCWNSQSVCATQANTQQKQANGCMHIHMTAKIRELQMLKFKWFDVQFCPTSTVVLQQKHVKVLQ